MEISYPDEVTIAGVQEFAAPKELVFEVFTQPEHLKQTLTPFDEKIVALEFDVRPGGMYDYTFVTPDGKPYRFFGQYLEVQKSKKLISTWHFSGWDSVEAVETLDFHDLGNQTLMNYQLRFRTPEGRAHMSKVDGVEAGYLKVNEYLINLQKDNNDRRIF